MWLPFRISGGFGHTISGKKARALSFTEEFSPEIIAAMIGAASKTVMALYLRWKPLMRWTKQNEILIVCFLEKVQKKCADLDSFS